MPRTLLLADDSITIQKVVSITFAAEDFTVVAVDNGEDALAKVRELRPAVVLADVVMPKRNGYELAQAIKSDPELGSIPVLLLAGTFEPFDAAKATSSRADGHIVKPFDSQALIDKVNELLGAAPAPRSQAPWTAAPAAAPAPAAPRAPVPSSASGMPQRPQPISTAIPRPGPVAPAPVARPPAPSPFAPAPQPFAPAPAPLPLRPAATAAPLPLRPAPLPLTQPMAATPPAPLPLTQPLAPAPLPLGASPAAGWGAAATPRPPAPAPVPSPTPASRLPAAPVAPKPISLTPAWGIPADAPAAPAPVSPPSRRDPFGLGQPAPATPMPKPAAAQMAEAAAAASVQPSPGDIQLDVPIDYEQDLTETGGGFELGSTSDFLDSSASSKQSASSFTSGLLADLAQQDTLSASGTIELSDEVEDEKLELAAPHEFLGGPPSPAAFAAPRPSIVAPAPVAPKPVAAPPKPAPLPLTAAIPATASPANGDGEAALRLALSQASREVIERVVWEVVPQLAEQIVREHVERLAQQRAGK